MTEDDGGDFEIDLESVVRWHRKPLKKIRGYHKPLTYDWSFYVI
jgi:hypothetical protein